MNRKLIHFIFESLGISQRPIEAIREVESSNSADRKDSAPLFLFASIFYFGKDSQFSIYYLYATKGARIWKGC